MPHKNLNEIAAMPDITLTPEQEERHKQLEEIFHPAPQTEKAEQQKETNNNA